MDAYVDGKRIRLDPSMSIGKGGEADVFDIGNQTALKLFKGPKHPDLTGMPEEQEAARARLQTHQTKLRQFPGNLPSAVVAPSQLATDSTGGTIIGYTMPRLVGSEVLLRYADPQWRAGGVPPDTAVRVLNNLARAVNDVHGAKVVIGDFNDLNVLVKGTDPYLIDADSFQFGQFLCRTFTPKFVDPLLCDARASSPMLVRPYGSDADWYAFSVMLMQCLLFVGPYGGVYRPKAANDRVEHDARPLHRISVFRPDVKRPKVMLDPGILPDDLVQFLYQTFEKDKRGPFPTALLEQLRWTQCRTCHTAHARASCPVCFVAAPAAVREVVRIRGTVKATRIFVTSGVVLYAVMQGSKPAWLYHENEAFRREDGAVLLSGALDPQMRFRLRGPQTLVGKAGQVITLAPGQRAETLAVDSYGHLPVFDANEDNAFWVQNGQLYRTDTLGPKYIGDVLRGQTLVWAGPSFGFGLYRAGQMEVAFVFDAAARGINDTVQLPKLNGHLVDATCVFGKDLCWFMTATHAGGVTTNRCVVLDRNGLVRAHASAPDGDASWLGTIRGAAAVGDSLFAATDDGIVRVRLDGATIAVTQSFPDTEPFVQAGSQLLAGKAGLYVVGRNDITLLQIT